MQSQIRHTLSALPDAHAIRHKTSPSGSTGSRRARYAAGALDGRAYRRMRVLPWGVVMAALVGAGAHAVQDESDSESVDRARALDARYNYKGWITNFPSFATTIGADDGGWRTRLAEHGFGFSVQGATIAQANMLDRPRRIPSEGFLPCGSANLGYNCAGGRSYFGQRPGAKVAASAYLTYDMSRHGVPNGQIALAYNYGVSSDQSYSVDSSRFNALAWYQTLFERKLEIKAGYFATSPEFAGTNVGGMTVNPFGPSASIPIVYGMTPNSMATPALKLRWNLDDATYVQGVVQRSLPVRTPTGNSIYEETKSNPMGLKARSEFPGTRLLYAAEAGHRVLSAPDRPFHWLRAGVLHNTSDFTDFERSMKTPGATTRGSTGFYVLGDYQITQPKKTAGEAYKGIYVGASFMYGDPKTTAFTKYYEARAYWFAPLESRPMDFMSLVYLHNRTSKHTRAAIDSRASLTNLRANEYSNALTASYTYKVRRGLYSTFGVTYTDHPSFQYFKGEGSALSALWSMYFLF